MAPGTQDPYENEESFCQQVDEPVRFRLPGFSYECMFNKYLPIGRDLVQG